MNFTIIKSTILRLSIIVGLKHILNGLFGPKNQSFRNKSGKTQPIRTKFGLRGYVKGWQRSGNFGRDRPVLAKMGAGTSPEELEFLLVNHATYLELCNGRFSPNLVTKRSSVSRQWTGKDIFENFHFRGHFPPKSHIEIRSNRHLTQSRLQMTGCTAERYCLLHVVVQGPGSFRGLVNFFVRRTVAELRGVNLPNFRILAYFPHTKPLKRASRSPVYSTGYIAEWLRFFMW